MTGNPGQEPATGPQQVIARILYLGGFSEAATRMLPDDIVRALHVEGFDLPRKAAHDASSATEASVEPITGSRDDPTSETPTETLLDADTLNAAADMLDALPPGGQALTGPYWYGQGMKDAANIMRDWADCPEALGPIAGQAQLRSSGPFPATPGNGPGGHTVHCPCHDTAALLSWLIAAGVDVTIGTTNSKSRASTVLRVSLDLDDRAWEGDHLSDLLATAKVYCELEGITP